MKRSLLSVVAILALSSVVFADDAATKPAGVVLKVADKEGIAANQGKEATLEGTVSEAAWSSTGKVMVVKFEGAGDSGFSAVVFQKNKEAFDKAFDGDAAKGMTGAKVKVTGKLATYKDKPQIVLNKPSQVVVDKGDAKPAADAKPVEQK